MEMVLKRAELLTRSRSTKVIRFCVLSLFVLVIGYYYKSKINLKPSNILSYLVYDQQEYPITIVTGYFSLASHQKGSTTRTPQTYFDILPLFKRLCFPLVVYSDSLDLISKLRIIRANLSDITKLHYVSNRSLLWAFSKEGAIKDIYQQPGYPKHHPNTVLATYSSVMHSKFDLVDMTIRDRVLPSELIGWMDFAYFRDVDKKSDLCLNISRPPDFNTSQVAYNKVYEFRNTDMEDIIRNNLVWVGGGFILGTRSVFSQHITDYRHQVDRMLSKKWMSTDQQVLYSMFQNQSLHSIDIQPYDSSKCHCDPWFCLGYLCINHTCAQR